MGYSSSFSSSSSSSSLSLTSSSGSLAAADLEAGFCGHPAIRESYYYRQRFLGPPPRAATGARLFFCDAFEDEEPQYFLESCFLCKKSLAGNGDIFMYRGDTPFCSEECRQEQIEIDEAIEKLSLKASPRKEQKLAQLPQRGKARAGAGASTGASASPPKSQNQYHARPDTVVAG